MGKAARGARLLISPVLTLGLMMTGLPGPGAAQWQTAGPKETASVLERWGNKIEDIQGYLSEGKSKRAYKQSEQLLHEMTNWIVGGAGAGELLARVTVLRAIAAVELGREDEGIWHWHVALQMFPDVKHYDLSAYGGVAEFLWSHPPRDENLDHLPIGGTIDGEIETPRGKVLPPRKKSALYPKLPTAMNRHGLEPVMVRVEVVIGKDGHPREPRIVESSGAPTLVCATLDKLRDWRFHPATLEGEAVPVYYNLSVNFVPWRAQQ